ncbi:hypothetical protein ACIBQ1_25935 [Nonomuraea sp. NPDC050153]|uniref:hypothetical protein n=1 Tax=Nonomuraea sp. NPDC050153 TaxID=3364359 RepID=UPI0037996738
MTLTLLTYTLMTDPTPLEASAAGRSPSTGTVYLIVTNTGRQAAFWHSIQVQVPVGNGAGHLTSDFKKIKPKGVYGTRSGSQSPVNVKPQGSDTFQATAQGGGRTRLDPGDHLVLTLENVTVAAAAGVAVLRVTENSSSTQAGQLSNRYAAVPLMKTTPKEIPAPRDFRPDDTMVNAGTNIVLRWEGSDDFNYKILFPGGQATVPQGVRSWSPAAADAPKRATTYTLVATSRTTPKQEHFLTTTVEVRDPVLETLTATTGISTPWVQGTASATGGRVTFTGTGAAISTNSGGPGSVTADKVNVQWVTAYAVTGPAGGDGSIAFRGGGVAITSSAGTTQLGTVFADKAEFNGVRTEWVQGRSHDDGWISFPKEGLNVRRGSGQDWGNVFADKADLNGVNTRWVQGRTAADGWISFPTSGLQVSRGGTDTPTQGNVYAESICARDAPYGQGGGWINLHDEGMTVYLSKNGSNGLGSVTASGFNR